jgi:hypothetical protein
MSRAIEASLGSHSWMRLPSGSSSSAKRPFGYGSAWGSTVTPAPRSRSTMPSRSSTRKLIFHVLLGEPNESESWEKAEKTVSPRSWNQPGSS